MAIYYRRVRMYIYYMIVCYYRMSCVYVHTYMGRLVDDHNE